ncbi:hypothetical protein QJS10_CPA06g02516 [Acorus calamus]|uniref:Uncharacterized protein n=1 Tax=Acorus calamus TaxID=4465 RepID=A0AAV9EJR0_ACOCL|nr:hypothetical protein QJS10_CPA06g02516 [Acorus calamus]
MVPIYAIESIISLWNLKLSLSCDILRNCYEAFALYSFGCYLVACLGGEERVIEILENETQKRLNEPLLEEEDIKRLADERSFHHFFFRPNIIGSDLYSIEKFGLVQYMILKTFCAFLAFILEIFGVYGDGEFKWYYGLESIKPLAKFISFKAIVFATWWQGVGIAIICYVGLLPKEGKFQNGLQDFLICIEMAIAAVAHIFVFSVKSYRYVRIPEERTITGEETKAILKLEEDGKSKPTIIEEKETHVEAPGTSVRESVQDVVLGGGEHVVKDVVLTITQAIEPMEKGVTKMQETFHQINIGPEDKEGEPKVEVEEHIEENTTESGSRIGSSEMVVVAKPDDGG